MRQTLVLSLVLLAAGVPAARSATSGAACQDQMLQSFRHIQHVVHDSSMIEALRAAPTIKKTAIHTLRGAIRLSHSTRWLERLVSKNPERLSDPKVRSMMCLAARSMHDYSAALRGLVEAGERLEHKRDSPPPPLTLSIEGVKFDTLPRTQVVADLEKRGFNLMRAGKSCDRFKPPADSDHASWLAVCWYRARWAFTRLQWADATGSLRFYTFEQLLVHEYGEPSSSDLRPQSISRAFADWSIAGGRGLVRIVHDPKMHLTLEDVPVTRAFAQAIARRGADRRAHKADAPGVEER